MPSNDAHFSGEGHLIEAEISGDANNTIRPVVCDAAGRLLVDLSGSVVDIGIVQIEDSTGNPITSTGGNLNENLAAVGGAPITEGQKTMANSIPVVIASDQSALPVKIEDTAGNALTSTSGSLNVNVTGGGGGGGTVNQGTPNTLANAWPVELSDGTNLLGTAVHPVRIDPTGTTTQPISGTVTTTPPANASTNLTEVGGAAISEGQKVSASSIPVVIASDQSAIAVTGTVTTSPNVNVHDGSGNSISSTTGSLNVDVTNTVPVTLTSTTITGNVTVVQPTGTNLHVVVDGTSPISGTVTANQGTANTTANSWPVEITDGTNILGTSAHPVRTDPTGSTTQPISGTVTSNIGTTGGLALDTSVNGLLETQGNSSSGVLGPMVMGVVPSGAPTWLAGTMHPIPLVGNGTVAVSGSVSVSAGSALDVQSSTVASAMADNDTNTTWFASSSAANAPLSVAQWIYGGAYSGTSNTTLQRWSKSRTSVAFNTVQATASGNTTVWTPGSGNKFRLLTYRIMITENASITSGAVVTLSFQDNTTAMPIAYDTFIPTTPITASLGDGFDTGWVNLGGFGILSAAANNILHINLGSTLATGNVRVLVGGTEE